MRGWDTWLLALSSWVLALGSKLLALSSWLLARASAPCDAHVTPQSINKLMSDFRRLVAWQRGMELARAAYTITAEFPRSELYGLSQQLRRAAVSVPCNVAEGHGRWHRKEFLQFLSVAHGSLNEVDTLLDLAEMLRFADSAALSRPRALVSETGKVLAGLRKSLRPSSQKRRAQSSELTAKS